MRRVMLGLCLAGLLFAVPIGPARAADAGVVRGSFNEVSPWSWKFQQINFTGTLTAGKQTYVGEFHIVKGMKGYGRYYTCPRFDIDPTCFYPRVHMDRFTWTAVRGTSNGQSLEGNCGGSDSDMREFFQGEYSLSLKCSVSIGGRAIKQAAINGEVVSTGTDFAGVYT